MAGDRLGHDDAALWLRGDRSAFGRAGATKRWNQQRAREQRLADALEALADYRRELEQRAE